MKPSHVSSLTIYRKEGRRNSQNKKPNKMQNICDKTQQISHKRKLSDLIQHGLAKFALHIRKSKFYK